MTTILAPLNVFGNVSLGGGAQEIDLSAFDPSDVISVALPDFPLTEIDTENTTIQFTSNEDGLFNIGPVDSVAFEDSDVALVNGDSELRFPIFSLETIDISSITSVRFHIETTDVCVFKCTAIRALSDDWVYSQVDVDTIDQTLKRPVPLNGAEYTESDFPSAGASGASGS